MRRKLLLVKPPEVTEFNFGTFSLAVLAAAVRREVEVVIVDATDLALDEAVRQVIAGQPDIVGVTVMSQESADPAAAFIRSLREAMTAAAGRAEVIAGGHGASMLPEPLLDAGADAVVIGEGELTLLEVIREGLRPGMDGLVVNGRNGPVRGKPRKPIQPLDLLEQPARDLIPQQEGVFLMETSRGCPHACRFCETTRFYGRSWRAFSPARVASEVRELVERHSAWIVHFSDDNFAADPDRVFRICEELVKGPLPAVIFASARADDLHGRPGLLEAMSAARIRRVSVGVETLDPATARNAGKQVPPEIYREVFASMRSCDIFSIGSFIVGLPGETAEARTRHLELALEAAPDSARFLPFNPLPGTPFARGIGRSGPDPADIAASRACTAAYRRHPETVSRLRAAVEAGGIRGIFAAKVLEDRESADS